MRASIQIMVLLEQKDANELISLKKYPMIIR